MIASWERSGLSQVAFCRRHGLSVATLRWWRWKLAREARGQRRGSGVARKAKLRFVPVRVVAPVEPAVAGGDAPNGIELSLAGGRVIRVGRGFDGAVLLELLRVLESSPC